MSRLPFVTSKAYGQTASSAVIGTSICSVTGLPPSRYKVWGNVRHAQTDGVRLTVTGQSNFVIAASADNSGYFGPVNVELTATSSTIGLELNVATGAGDTASANLYVERVNP